MQKLFTRITNKTAEPEGEVLCIGYQDEMLVGYLGKQEDGDWVCDAGDTELTEVKAFVPVATLVDLFKKHLI